MDPIIKTYYSIGKQLLGKQVPKYLVCQHDLKLLQYVTLINKYSPLQK